MIQENTLIGQYLVLQEKNGIVVARDTRNDWLVQLVKLPSRWGSQKAAFQALVKDLQAVMSLQNENTQILDAAFEHKHNYYLAFRYVEAAPLEKILRELKALSIEEVKRLANQVGGALISAHGLGAVHGNVEIKNLMVNKDGDYILAGFTDLPLSKYNKTPLKYKAGSAPELLAGEQASFGTDQYSLAKILKNLVERAKKASDFKKSDLSQGMLDALNKALNKNPNERYSDVNAFMRAFNSSTQPNKNSTNAARNQAGSNSRKQESLMDFSEIPPSYLPSSSLTSGAESALSQAISSSVENPYAMWSGVSPIEAQSQAPTMRVGAQSPQIVVEDFEINPGKSGGADKDNSMRNIPKYKPAFDVDLSNSGAKNVDEVFPFDDDSSPASPHKDRMHTFVLALGMVMIILVAVTMALLGGNTPLVKLPGSKDVSANLDLSGVMQSTLAKGTFPTGTPNLISVVPIATQFPSLQTQVYDGLGGGLNLSPTPTATITLTPTPSATSEPEVPGAFATAPANTGFYWDIVFDENPTATQKAPIQDAIGGQGPEPYFDVQMDTPVPETPAPAIAEETTITEPSPTEWVPVVPSPEAFYWDIVIEFPSPLETETPMAALPISQPAALVVASPTSEPAAPVVASPTSEPVVPVVASPSSEPAGPVVATPISQPAAPVVESTNTQPLAPIEDQTSIQPAGQPETLGANLQTQVAAVLPLPSATPQPVPPTPTIAAANPVEAQVGVAAPQAGLDFKANPTVQAYQGGSQETLPQATPLAPKPTPVPMLAGSIGSASDVKTTVDTVPNLVVTVLDGRGRPVADREVMVLPVVNSPVTVIDTPLFSNPVQEPILPILPILDTIQPAFEGGIGRTDAFGQIHFDLDPGSFQVVYVPSGQVTDSDAMVHYQVQVAAASQTELTLHRELVTVDFVSVEGNKVEIPGLALARLDKEGQMNSQNRKPTIIPLNLEPARQTPEEFNVPDSGFGSGGAEPLDFPILDLTPGKYELVQISQGGQENNPLGITVEVLQGQVKPVEVQLGRLVLPAAFLEQDGKAGDTLQVTQQVTASGTPSLSNEPIASLVYQGEAVLKIDLLPGTYSLNWAGTSIDNISIRAGEASDVYVGPKGGK